MAATVDLSPEEQLFIAAENNDVEEMEFIITQAAVDVNWKNPKQFQYTALHVAAAYDNTSAIKVLIKANADLNALDRRGDTPLMRATYNKCKESVELLLENGANPKIKNKEGKTALNEDADFKIADMLKNYSDKAYHEALLQALEEGFVTIRYSKFCLSGPPGSGKSSLMRLLKNEMPLYQHDSTPFTTVRQVNTTSIGESGSQDKAEWRVFDYKTLKAMVAKQLNERPVEYVKPSDSTISQQERHKPKAVKDIVNSQLENNDDLRSSSTLDSVHWIYGTDSGGQAAFLDIAPALLRYNSVNILVHKLDEALHDQPQFFFSVGGHDTTKSNISIPVKREMTHMQLLHSSIRSLISIPSCTTVSARFTKANSLKPIFLILGTFLDKKKSQLLISEKNKILYEKFKGLIKDGILKPYKVTKKAVIYPVVAIDRGDDAQAIATEIRSMIRKHYIEASVPLRWFLFQLDLKENFGNASVISISDAIKIGSSLKMNHDDVKAALEYYHDLTIILYFPSILPNVVFFHPQPLFDMLSNLICVSFADTTGSLFIDSVKVDSSSSSNLDDYHLLLKDEGKFDITLLEHFPEGFTDDFTASDFLLLMESLLIIASIGSDQYFIPCVLETCADDQMDDMKKKFSNDCDCDPLIVTWDEKIVPQGMHPALVVRLLKKEFDLLDEKPYRNAIRLQSQKLGIRVLIVDAIFRLEIYCAGPVDACPDLKHHMQEAIEGVSKQLYEIINSNAKYGTLCSECHTDVCHSNERGTYVTCFNSDCPPKKITERQSCWEREPTCSGSDSVCNVLPEGTTLNMSHAHVVECALEEIVFDWDHLGLFLGIKCGKLNVFKYDCQKVEECRKEMIHHWLKSGTATRQNLISALKAIKREDVAEVVESLPKS